MRRFFLIFILMLSLGGVTHAQFGNFGDKPVEITADGDQRFENGTAVADNNVQIRYGGIAIYADHAEYNPDTRDILLVGNVRIYSGEDLFNGQRAFYNLETKQVRALEFDGSHYPLKFSSLSAKGFGTRQFTLSDTDLTTSDSSMPDCHVRAKTIRIYPNDRVVMLNSTLDVGKIPVFWLPYAYGNLRSQGLQISPGYDSNWGGYLLTSYTFPLGTGDNFLATIRQDYRTLRGYAAGFDANLKFGKNDRSYGKFISYYADDQKSSQKLGGPGELPENGSQNRYRIGYQGKMYLEDDLYASFDITKLSDRDFMQDFYPAENMTNPQPDNNVTLTKLDDIYSLSLVTRWQMNSFQETTERKPEAAFDFKQEPLLGLPVFYDGTTALGQLNRNFAQDSFGTDYGATRFDTFHQISAPQTLWGWLSAVPKVGVRGTFYSQGGYFSGTNGVVDPFPYAYTANGYTNGAANVPAGNTLHTTGNVFRPIFNAGLENSFKISRSFEGVQSRWLGLDGLRHIFQPYSNLSYVYAGGPNANQVLQFDRLLPNNPNAATRSGYQPSSTQLEPLDFPQFGAIDAIDTWAIWRLGARNRLQTRRDGDTYDWFFLDTFADVNGINPYVNGPISNLNNRLTFAPVSWFYIRIGSQVPLVAEGFTELNSDFSVMPVRNFSFNFGTRYINNYNGSSSDNQYPFGAFWKVNDHWSLSAQEIYNQAAANNNSSGSALIYQRYMIHRDLSSWIVSFGAEVRANKGTATQGGQNQYGALLTFTLKDLPQVTLPLAFSGASQAGSSPLSPTTSH
jgi:lipopolysaccharide assembly outer membrane protein LptD (OstA)